TVAAGAQLVVGLAPGGIAQRLVGLVDGLELVLGAGFLADVGMVFAREPAVGGLDLRLSGIGLHAQDAVVILELHARSTTTARVRAVAVYRRRDAISARPARPPGSGEAWFPAAWGSRSPARRCCRWRPRLRDRRCRAERNADGSCHSVAPPARSAPSRWSIRCGVRHGWRGCPCPSAPRCPADRCPAGRHR